MTTTLISPVSTEDKKPRAAPKGFAGRELLEPLANSSGPIQKLKENLLSCTSPDFDIASLASSLTAIKGTSISGGPAMLLQSGSGNFLLYKEPYEGFHLIVSGLLGLTSGSHILKRQDGTVMHLVHVPPEKLSVF
jgi:hypothetical protein